MTDDRLQIGRVQIDVLDRAGALDRISLLVREKRGGTVFTPNVDHIVLSEQDERFRRAYARASLSLVDGMPLLWASRLLGRRLPEKISGSDLVVPLLERSAVEGWRVFILGGGEGVADRAADILRARIPNLVIVGTAAPRIDLRGDPNERAAVAGRVMATWPDLVLVALGSPKQEIFCDETRAQFRPAVLVGVGAGIDFVAGVARRAPAWISKVGLEWAYRLAHEPRRLASRYLLRDPQFAGIFLKQMLAGPAAIDEAAPR